MTLHPGSRSLRWLAFLALAGTVEARAAAPTPVPSDPVGKAVSMTLDQLLTPTPGASAWGWLPQPLETSLPDFEKTALLSRGGGARAAAMREATVILGTSDGGFGSGAILSPDGWILTNYHVVAMEAQKAAITGGVPRLKVFLGKLDGKKMRLREETPFAAVYRVDPVHDLALLKIEGELPGGIHSFKIAPRGAETGMECYSIGSQGAGFPWLLRPGKVLGVFDYPLGITEVLIGADPEGGSLERTRLSVVVTDCPISPGDSGGPLVNANGDLIGLTFATPANLSSGSMGLHVDGAEIARFVDPLPQHPDPVPFDPWVAGLPAAFHAPPRAGILHEEGKAFYVLQVVHLAQTQLPVAELLFFDLDARTSVQIAGTDTLMSLLPIGLWGMEQRGGFDFDVFLARRFDRVTAVGFPDARGVVSEIRIDSDGDAASDVIWRRSVDGRWQQSAEKRPLLDTDRLDARALRCLSQAIEGQKHE